MRPRDSSNSPSTSCNFQCGGGGVGKKREATLSVLPVALSVYKGFFWGKNSHLEKQGRLNTKRDHFVMSYFINLCPANNHHFMAVEFCFNCTAKDDLQTWEKFHLFMKTFSFHSFLFSFPEKKVTGTNPIKCDNHFSGPLSSFCNYAVPYYFLKNVLEKHKIVKRVQTWLGNGKKNICESWYPISRR